METMKADIVVVGSGMGGMCSAALLAHAGYRAIVLESQGFIGGRFSGIEYKGYTIATGGHMINHGKDDPSYMTLLEVGAPEIECKEFKVPVKYRIGGKDILLDGKGGLKNLVFASGENEEVSGNVMKALYRAIRWQEPDDALSMKDWLLQQTDNPRIHNIFQSQATAFTGLHLRNFPAGEFIRFLRTYARLRSTLVPKHTGKAMMDAFRSVIRRHGGLVLTSARATRILVEDGKARGVIFETGGRKIQAEAKAVVSNAGPGKTIALAGERNFDGWYVKRVSENVKPTVVMDYIIASKKPLLDCMLLSTDARRVECWSSPTHFWPEEAPPGMHVLEGYAAPLACEGYDPREEREIFLQDMKQEFPHFEECEAKVLLARRFCGEWPVNRCYQGHDLPQKTPVEYLYNVGDGVKPPGWVGASGAAMSGRIVAADIKERIPVH